MFSLLKEVISSASCLGTGEPSNVYVPAVGLSNAEMQFKRVVLPEPDGPRRMTLSPPEISKLTPSSALTVPEAMG
jgi:hypothetical protein